jgi:hypothetical protein
MNLIKTDNLKVLLQNSTRATTDMKSAADKYVKLAGLES